MRNRYTFECRDAAGNLRWADAIDNLVTNEGLNDWLDKYLKGSSYTAAWYVGLISSTDFGAIQSGDTAVGIRIEASGSGSATGAGSNQWEELDDYTEGVRQTLTLGTVASQSVDNSASKASFSINATVTIKGGFVASNSGKGSGAGVLLGAAAFASERSMFSGDTLNVTVTLTAASG